MRHTSSGAAVGLGCIVAAVLLVGTSCSDVRPQPAAQTTTTTEVTQPADLAAVAPGTLLQSQPLEPADVRITRADARATRITYRSTSGIDGSPTSVTGAVFVPQGKPPADGWPIVAYAHPTVGLLEDCGPSMHTDLMGAAPQIESLLADGYLVVMPDYQGLGSKGPHPYLEPRTAGYNVIDAVRAARQLAPAASSRWAVYGASQGGQAAWSATDLSASYGKGLDMVGGAALAPAADISALPSEALAGRLSKDQLPLMQFVVNTVSAVKPGFDIDNYLSGFALQNNTALLQCSGAGLTARNRLVFNLAAADVTPKNQEAADRMANVLHEWSVPLADKSPVPLLVIIGSKDDMVRPDWVQAAAHRACDRGDPLVWNLADGEGHDNVDFRPALLWLRDRFNNVPLGPVCAFGGTP